MNSLKLTLLLSLAPVVLTASSGHCCDRTEVIQDEQCSNQMPDFIVFKAEDVCNATQAYISVTNEAMSDENWNFLRDLTKSVFGEATEQSETSINFTIDRCELSDKAWCAILATIEAQFIVLKEVIEANPQLTGGVITISINK